MKSILYVGAALMIGASIYGFIDYKKTSHKEEFTAMYDEKKSVTPVITMPEKKMETVVVANKEENKKVVTKKQTKKTVAKKHSIKPISEQEKLVAETKEIEITSVDTDLAAKVSPEKSIKKRKKITREIFSRAPIRDYEPEEKKVKTTKKDQSL